MSQTKVEAPFVANNAHFKNLFINGDMQIAQRATSASSVNATGFHACDRWGYITNGSGLVVTMSQDTDVPTGEGFTTSLKFDVTTADTSTASAERVHFGQTIEAQNLQHLASATSSAKKVTLSFWVKSTITGTYAVAIYKGDQTARLVNATYTISSADTWEHKTITFPGDTGGGGIDNDNGSGFQFDWFLIAGTDSTSGGAQTTWANFAAASWAGGHNVNFGSSTANNYYITGVQLEVGDQATDFEHLPHDVQLQRCQRYYFKLGPGAQYDIYSVGASNGTDSCYGAIHYPVQMRGDPTLGHSGTAADYCVYQGSHNPFPCDVVPASNTIYNYAMRLKFGCTGDMVAGEAGELLAYNTSAYLEFDAEI